MALDLSKFDNKFKVELRDDGKCKKCGQFHKLNVKAKLIADCNGNFDPAQHKEYVNAKPVQVKEDNSAVLGEQTIDPMVIAEGEHDLNWAIRQHDSGKDVTRPGKGMVHHTHDRWSWDNLDGTGSDMVTADFTATDWKLWRSAEDVKLHCKLDGNALHIFGDDFENLQESPSMFIKLTKKEFKEFKEFQEKLL